jgi:hypothetical protein
MEYWFKDQFQLKVAESGLLYKIKGQHENILVFTF